MKTDTHAFIIRIWNEASEGEDLEITWRGSIEHVGSNQRLYFQNLSSIVHFIRERSGMDSQRPLSWWRWAIARFRDKT